MTIMTKENMKEAKYLQQLLIERKKDYTKSDIEKGGLDTSLKKFELGNFRVEKDSFFGLYTISVIDKQKDIYGNPISQKSEFIHRVRSLWETGKKEIPFSEVFSFDIITPASEIRIGNILLSNYLGLTKSYDISLIDKEKNIDNKWLNNAVTINRVMDALLNFHYDENLLALAEVPLNKEIEKYFKEHFESVKKSDTSNKGLIDLTIGNEKSKIAIELKLSRKIKLASESQKCRGQIEDYKKQFGSNLILVIAGEKTDRQEKYLQECIKKAEELGIKCFFIEAKK